MKHTKQSLAEKIEEMINNNENLLLEYTVDELIEMAASGETINIDGSASRLRGILPRE